MEVNLRQRVKTTLETIIPGNTFRLIDKVQAFMVIDLTKNDMFAEVAPNQDVAILRQDVVYVLDLATGVCEVLPKTLPVYEVKLKTEEID